MLQPVHAEPDDLDLPTETKALIAAGREQVEQYFDLPAESQAPGYVPSDFEAAFRTLRTIVREELAPGRVFCEWGSGVGVVTLLAAQLGLKAYGIEIEPDLVRASRELAARFGLNAEFAEGSFLPDGEAEDFVPGDVAWLRFDGADAWDDLALDPREIDIVYAYPWPGEEDAIEDVFDSIAAHHALLVTFHGREGVKVRRQRRQRG